jgi:hypothetical protein
MKKILIFLFSMFLSANTMAQVFWARNYDVAVGAAEK